MRRRDFIALMMGSPATWPIAVGAQPRERMRRIGLLIGLAQADQEGQRWQRKFIQTLRDAGWRNGTNVQIDLRFARDLDQMRAFSKELVELQPDVIHVATTLATAEVLRQTQTIPVVFSMVNDPVEMGFVQSPPKPDGNATGFTNISPGLGGKWLELIREMDPRIKHVALLHNLVSGARLQRR
jgi:putative ABC transport system substrate-binding protein